jgi:hypothetical protein
MHFGNLFFFHGLRADLPWNPTQEFYSSNDTHKREAEECSGFKKLQL